MSGNNDQIQRIEYYENIFDTLTKKVKKAQKALDELEKARPLIDELSAYYAGKEWKKDYADDEKGRIPKDVKRGVLSEDGINDLLDEIRALRKE